MGNIKVSQRKNEAVRHQQKKSQDKKLSSQDKTKHTVPIFQNKPDPLSNGIVIEKQNGSNTFSDGVFNALIKSSKEKFDYNADVKAIAEKNNLPKEYVSTFIEHFVKQNPRYSKKFVTNLISNEGMRTKTYKDTSGKKTIGIGHNINADRTATKDVNGDGKKNYYDKYGDSITQAEMGKMLKEDLITAETHVYETVGKAKMTRSQREALIDVAFNVGEGNFKDCSKLTSHIKKGDMESAACEFNMIAGGGKVQPGLVLRNLNRMETFCDGKYTPKIVNKMITLRNKGLKVKHSKYYKHESKKIIEDAKKSMK